jgi:hypothetical protein
MDIILLDNNLDEIANSSCSDLLTDEEKRKVCNYAGLDQETSDFKRINIGPGADLFVILAAIWKTIEVVGTVYTAVDLSKRFGSFIGKIKEFVKNRQLVSIDEDGAKLLAMDYVIKTFKSESIRVLDLKTVIPSGGGSYIEYPEHPIAMTPHRYYIFVFEIDGGDTVVMGVKSTGEMEVIKAFEFDPYGLTEARTLRESDRDE